MLFCLRKGRVMSFAYSSLSYLGKKIAHKIKSKIKAIKAENLINKFSSNLSPLDSCIYETCQIQVSILKTTLTINREFTWFCGNEDIEGGYLLHRFGWLLENIALTHKDGEDIDEAYCIMNLWLKNNNHNILNGWDSYSVSERIVNWILIFGCKNKNNDSILNDAIQSHMYYLSTNLEYRGEETNNHILNNARALIISGCYSGNKTYVENGLDILTGNMVFMIRPSGFLREGSSHYQLLICRTFIEILLFLNKYNPEFITDILIAHAYKTWLAACALLELENFPFIGDISPDFNAEFHYSVKEIGGLIFDNNSLADVSDIAGWGKVILNNFPVLPNYNKYTQDCKPVNYLEAGYFFHKTSLYEVCVFVNSESIVNSWSHAHSDAGGFCLSWNGDEVISDQGRLSYINSKLNNLMRSAEGNSSITIDEREPRLIHGINSIPDSLPNCCHDKPAIISCYEEGDHSVLKISNLGFSRLGHDISVTRTFFFYEEYMEIFDNYEGSGEHSLQTFFSLSPDIINIDNENKNIYRLKTENHDLKLSSSCADVKLYSDVSESISSKKYGESINTKTIKFSANVIFPHSNNYKIGKY